MQLLMYEVQIGYYEILMGKLNDEALKITKAVDFRLFSKILICMLIKQEYLFLVDHFCDQIFFLLFCFCIYFLIWGFGAEVNYM